jgi:SNF2 family DNA or RNA helicase
MDHSEFLTDGQQITVNWAADKYFVPVTIRRIGNRIWFQFAYNKTILTTIKEELEGIKWHGFEDPPEKMWSALYSEHNIFRIAYHMRKNPYKRFDEQYDLTLISNRPLKAHQIEGLNHVLHRKQALLAYEMGLGKTLIMIEAMERSRIKNWLWVGPKAAIYSVQLDFVKWNSSIKPTFITYNAMTSLVENWKNGTPAYQGIVFDESHNLKTPTSKRTLAARHLTESSRKEYGDDAYVIAMTGTPAPKSPMDWWSQCQIIRPGFLREGNIHNFKRRLAIVREADTGNYEQVVAWRDSTDRCNECGQLKSDPIHDSHTFVPAKNEVEALYKRMKGLVSVKFKKDCLDLPDKIMRRIQCKIPKDLERAAKLITNTSKSTVVALTRLRELSDGFQYEDKQNGTKLCPECSGAKISKQREYVGPDLTDDQIIEICNQKGLMIADTVPYESMFPDNPEYFEMKEVQCYLCDGLGQVPDYVRTYTEIDTPKIKVLVDLLEEYEQSNRVVIFAGFTASIDRIQQTVTKHNWDYIAVDGRGWKSSLGSTKDPRKLLEIFQDKSDGRRIAFIGHPGSAGVGLTLTASPVAIFYSNDFSGVNRIQAMDRIHRMGMDENLGATIIDICNLPTDTYVLENLEKKVKLQDISLGRFKEAIANVKLDLEYSAN